MEKKRAFLQKDQECVGELDRDFQRKATLAKMKQTQKVEQQVTSGNAWEAWQGLNTKMGRDPKPPSQNSSTTSLHILTVSVNPPHGLAPHTASLNQL